jgi:hypothetical protein
MHWVVGVQPSQYQGPAVHWVVVSIGGPVTLAQCADGVACQHGPAEVGGVAVVVAACVCAATPALSLPSAVGAAATLDELGASVSGAGLECAGHRGLASSGCGAAAPVAPVHAVTPRQTLASGSPDVGHVVGVGVSDAVGAGALHEVAVCSPVLGPGGHVVVGGVVDAAGLALACSGVVGAERSGHASLLAVVRGAPPRHASGLALAGGLLLGSVGQGPGPAHVQPREDGAEAR